MTTLSIAGSGIALPGRGYPGNVYTGKEVLDYFLIGKQKKRFVPKSTYESWLKMVRKVEKASGIQTRGVCDDKTIQFPNTFFAKEAAINALEKANLNPKDVQGFVFLSNTPDLVFPPPGLPVAELLGIKPVQFANASLACVSIANAFYQAAHWIKDGLCDNVLVVAGDVTTRLQLKENKLEPLFFGDGFAAFVLKKGDKDTRGGFTVTNLRADTDLTSLFLHRAIYSTDFDKHLALRLQDNDTGIDILGDIDGLEFAYQLLDYLENSKDLLTNDVKIIGPQIGRMSLMAGKNKFQELSGSSIDSNLVPNTSLCENGNIGVGAVPAAFVRAMLDKEISANDKVVFNIAGVGGLETVFKWDPNAEDALTVVKTSTRHERPDYKKMIDDIALGTSDRYRKRKNGDGKDFRGSQLTRFTGDSGVRIEHINPVRRTSPRASYLPAATRALFDFVSSVFNV